MKKTKDNVIKIRVTRAQQAQLEAAAEVVHLDLSTWIRQVALVEASRVASSSSRAKKTGDFDHECEWRKAALMLAKCVVATVQTGGKIGMGTGMVMKVVDGKKTIERWDKDFIEALAFIGIGFEDPKPAKKPEKPAARHVPKRRMRPSRTEVRAA